MVEREQPKNSRKLITSSLWSKLRLKIYAWSVQYFRYSAVIPFMIAWFRLGYAPESSCFAGRYAVHWPAGSNSVKLVTAHQIILESWLQMEFIGQLMPCYIFLLTWITLTRILLDHWVSQCILSRSKLGAALTSRIGFPLRAPKTETSYAISSVLFVLCHAVIDVSVLEFDDELLEEMLEAGLNDDVWSMHAINAMYSYIVVMCTTKMFKYFIYVVG